MWNNLNGWSISLYLGLLLMSLIKSSLVRDRILYALTLCLMLGFNIFLNPQHLYWNLELLKITKLRCKNPNFIVLHEPGRSSVDQGLIGSFCLKFGGSSIDWDFWELIVSSSIDWTHYLVDRGGSSSTSTFKNALKKPCPIHHFSIHLLLRHCIQRV